MLKDLRRHIMMNQAGAIRFFDWIDMSNLASNFIIDVPPFLTTESIYTKARYSNAPESLIVPFVAYQRRNGQNIKQFASGKDRTPEYYITYSDPGGVNHVRLSSRTYESGAIIEWTSQFYGSLDIRAVLKKNGISIASDFGYSAAQPIFTVNAVAIRKSECRIYNFAAEGYFDLRPAQKEGNSGYYELISGVFIECPGSVTGDD